MSRHNNPVNLALWESRRLWPAIEHPDVIVSLGTGMQDITPTSPMKGAWSTFMRAVLSNRGVPRLWSSMKGFLEGEETSRDLRNTLNPAARNNYFRFNVALPGPTPAIDDVECMDGLSKHSQVQSRKSESYKDAAIALLVSCFFFELDCLPTMQTSGTYYCRGSIRCRFPDGQALVNALLHLADNHMVFYKDCKGLGCKLQEEDLCGTCHRYNRKIQFLATSLEEPLTLSLRWGDSSRKLSAMPHPLSWFIKMQQLDAPFGSRNHGTTGAIQCPSCKPGPIASCHTCEAQAGGKRHRLHSPKLEEAPLRKSARKEIELGEAPTRQRHRTARALAIY
jgi:hypothetical protein